MILDTVLSITSMWCMTLSPRPATPDPSRVGTIHERLARRRKVDAMTAVIDEWCLRLGFNPYLAAQHVLPLLETMAEDGWRSFAELARVNPPSATTKAELLSVFRGRVRAFRRVMARASGGAQ